MSTVLLNPTGDNRQPQEQTPSNAYAVANWFLGTFRNNNKPITLAGLQKFVYLAFGWYCVHKNTLLFDDRVAMSHSGPVIVPLEKMFSCFGEKPITRTAQIFQDDKVEVLEFSVHPENCTGFEKLSLKEQQRLRRAEHDVTDCLRHIYLEFRETSYDDLSTAVCCPGTKIHEMYKNLDKHTSYADIPIKMIQEYFKEFFDTQ
ncbi:MAG: DUF4065 domain-containing protein [Planctomycetaceae bacterium]|jgi:uncharacterized phage-associated protein|nr:DUF4065 domain-containing protein [Planctomycetaceae bacterium]